MLLRQLESAFISGIGNFRLTQEKTSFGDYLKLFNEKTSKLIVYSNAIFSTNMSISMSNSTMSAISFYNNEDMIVNSVNYLTEKENSITIRKKYGDTVKFTVTEKESKNIIKIIYGVPFLIILVGYIVWRIRRNKK